MMRSLTRVCLVFLLITTFACTKEKRSFRGHSKSGDPGAAADGTADGASDKNGTAPGTKGTGPERKVDAEGKGVDQAILPREGGPADTPMVWRRYYSVAVGLGKGLALDPLKICMELGKKSCVGEVHLSILGGNNPFTIGQMERSVSPTALTPLAMERVVYSACAQRLAADIAAGPAAEVFKHFPLQGPLPSDAALEKQVSELFQRLLARNPDHAEVGAIKEFAKGAGTPDKLAVSLCVAIGTMIESTFL